MLISNVGEENSPEINKRGGASIRDIRVFTCSKSMNDFDC